MEFLKLTTWTLLAAFLASGCGEISVTRTFPLETDTYISSANFENHAELDSLRISKSSALGLEERAVVKLPTTDKEGDDVLDEALENFFRLFFMPIYIVASFTNCGAVDILDPANLTAATLEFDATSGSPSNSLTLELLSKPWWQSATWKQAHPFSKQGYWATQGGDVDLTSFTPVLGTVSGSTVKFDIVNYFKSLISANGTAAHYGFLIRSAGGADLSTQILHSTQSSSTGLRPRVVATYSATCPNTYGQLRKRTTYLGAEPLVLDVPLQ